MRLPLAIAGVVILAGCVGHEMQTIDLPDGTHELHVTSYVKHAIGPNTQTDITYRCTGDLSACHPIHADTGAGSGILDLVPSAALDGAVGLSNVKPDSINVSGGSPSASAVGAGGSATGGAANATTMSNDKHHKH